MEGEEAEAAAAVSSKKNWSEEVEDLIDAGDTDAAIALLESIITALETTDSPPPSSSQLPSALLELSKLYSSKGLSLKSDKLSSRAHSLLLLRSTEQVSVNSVKDGVKFVDSRVSTNHIASCSNENVASVTQSSQNVNLAPQESSDDDWEAMVDRTPDELLSVAPQSVPEVEVSELSLNERKKVKVTNRRGRGTFAYKKQGLYSDQQGDDDVSYESPDEEARAKDERAAETSHSVYGTHHVLVLDGFHPSTTTIDLEKLFEDFRDRGFAIRWVHDTLALAVFRTPSVACEALDSIHCSFSVRVMEEDDLIKLSVKVKDLEPPRQRPKTSARTAQRLIAQELGVKLPSNFGSRELRKQEDARKTRITTRQNLRDEAWGPDDT